MAVLIWIFALLAFAAATPHEDVDDLETESKPKFQNAKRLRYDGTVVLHPDDNVITADRVRTLLRNGVSSVRLGNKTIASLDPEKSFSQSPPKTVKTTEKVDDSDEDDEPKVLITTPRSVKVEKSTRIATKSTLITTRSTKAAPALITASALITSEDADDDDDEDEIRRPTTVSTKKSGQSVTKLITESSASARRSDEEQSTASALRRQFLEARHKKFLSSIANQESTTPIATTIRPSIAPTSPNLLEQIFRNFALFAKPSPPPSPFLPDGNANAPLPTSTAQTTSPTILNAVETEATIPFVETTTTTTEAPMPPPEPDYVLASKQLTPFVSGVRQLDSESTREALDTASQIGQLTWLVNYYQNVPPRNTR